MLEKNAGAYYYTVIARLIKAGDVKKSGKKIRLVPKNETPPEENPESTTGLGKGFPIARASGEWFFVICTKSG
jgi:hypothetical protein